MYQVHDMVLVNGAEMPIEVGSPAWFSWLSEVKPASFSLRQEGLTCTFRCERRGEASFWYAYQKQQGKLRKAYAGPTSALTREHVAAVLAKVKGAAPAKAPTEVEEKREAEPVVPTQIARLLLLGTPALYVNDKPVALSAKTFALLAYLALVETPPTRDQLFALLWPESAQEAARKNLQNMLWQLRSLSSAQKDIIQLRPDGRVTLETEVWIDARAFLETAEQDQKRAQALALYRGPFLDGLTFGDAASLEHWLLTERERFTQAGLRLLTAQIEVLRSDGAWSEMLEVTRRALAIDPLQEPLHRFGMLAYARLGQRTQALRQYEQLRLLLDSELGIAPLPETEALREAIGRGSIAALPRTGRASLTPQDALAPSLPFVGRVRERELLDTTLQQVLQRQQARVVALAGELGIGKSRLWREWSVLLPGSHAVIECRCLESTQTIPLAPLTRLLSSVFVGPHAPSLEPLWLAELARLIPELKMRYPHLPAPVSLPPEQERGRLFEACLHALHALGKLPLLLFVDDLHWADQATLDWLAYCLDSMQHLPLLLIVAYRPQDAPETLTHLLAAWEREGAVQQMVLAPLSAQDAASVIAAQKTSVDHDSVTLYQQSAGNPYYLGELLRAGGGDIPSSLKTLIQARLNSLPAITRQVVQAAAILDPDIELDPLRFTSGRNEDEILDALDILLESSFLREGEEANVAQEEFPGQQMAYMFAHPFAASVLRDGLTSARRIALHRRAAEALTNRYAAQLPSIAGRLYKHYEEAGQRGQAAHYAEMAGNYALAVASSVEARTLFQQALALESSAPRYMGLALAHMYAGALEESRAALQQALPLFFAQKDAQGTLKAVTYYFESYTLASQFKEAIQWSERPEIQAYTSIIDPDIAAILRSLITIMKYRLVTPSLELAERESSNLFQLLKSKPDQPIALRAYLMLATTLAEQGRWREAIEAYRDLERTARALGDIFQEVLARNNVAYHTILLGELELARAEIEEVLALVKSYELHGTHFYVYSTYGELWLAQQDWREAERWFKRALAQLKQRNQAPSQMAELYANLGRAAQGRGDLPAATRLLEHASGMMRKAGVPFQRIQIDLWQADLYAASGKEDAARDLLKQIETSLQHSGWQELQRRATELARRISQSAS